DNFPLGIAQLGKLRLHNLKDWYLQIIWAIPLFQIHNHNYMNVPNMLLVRAEYPLFSDLFLPCLDLLFCVCGKI
ncbi:MAG: hypothetical protein SF053_03380, partial [Bacteroidia bacterium]|nr:hypothetical protein [Bacteroidia bacterium]